MRYLILAAVCLFVVGCWATTKTDERKAPIGEAMDNAVTAFQEGSAQAPVLPGVPTWILGIVFGGTAAVSAFVTTLVNRKRQLDAKTVQVPAPAIPRGAT